LVDVDFEQASLGIEMDLMAWSLLDVGMGFDHAVRLFSRVDARSQFSAESKAKYPGTWISRLGK